MENNSQNAKLFKPFLPPICQGAAFYPGLLWSVKNVAQTQKGTIEGSVFHARLKSVAQRRISP